MRSCAAVAAVLVFSAFSFAADPPPVTGSHAQLGCKDCHEPTKTADCSECHEAKLNIHPVGVTPSFEIPNSFELGPDRKILCRTCHRLHGGDKGHYFVRSAPDKDPADRRAFCESCHGARLARTSPHDASRGSARCSYCHASVPGKGAGGKGTARTDIVKLCDFCHNVVAKDHPRNIDPAISLPRGLPLLADGSWTCVTCHNPHGTTETTHFIRPEFARHLERGRQDNTHQNTYTACRGCHTTSIADKIRPPDYSLRYKADINILCISCHLTDKSHHPTGVLLPPTIKTRLDSSALEVPIDSREGITCLTCHDNNCSTDNQHMTLRHYDRRELRSDLCWICHDHVEFTKQNPHVDDPEKCTRCHEARPMKGSKASARLVASPKMLCLWCHSVKPHPAGADHLRVPSDKIRPDGSLPLGAAGEIVCATCHEPHAMETPTAWRLRDHGMQLCAHCHLR